MICFGWLIKLTIDKDCAPIVYNVSWLDKTSPHLSPLHTHYSLPNHGLKQHYSTNDFFPSSLIGTSTHRKFSGCSLWNQRVSLTNFSYFKIFFAAQNHFKVKKKNSEGSDIADIPYCIHSERDRHFKIVHNAVFIIRSSYKYYCVMSCKCSIIASAMLYNIICCVRLVVEGSLGLA